ncbi:MAG: Kelch repeat-containing protein, partial [Thermoplasmata archaeon]
VFGGSPLHWSPFDAPPGWAAPSDGWIGTARPGGLTGAYGGIDAPPPRYDAGLVGTPYGGLLLFGGASPIGSPLGDSWAANPLTSLPADFPYSGLVGPEFAPPAEYGSAEAFDPADSVTVLFAGCGFSCGNQSTWLYSPYSAASRTQAWQAEEPSPRNPQPPARLEASLVATTLDGGSVLLFGGRTGAGTPMNDLWQFVRGEWTELTPLGALPAPRSSAALAFNASSGEIILFGGEGEGSSGPLGDTWALQYLPALSEWTWSQIVTRQAPSARSMASFGYDAASGALVLFGGCGASVCPLGDTWSYGDGAWTECATVSCAAAGPAARYGAALTYDPSVGALLLFGGCGRSCPLGDTW